MNVNEIGSQIVKLCIDIHKKLGPGLLESVYEIVLASELEEMGFQVERQIPIKFAYKGKTFTEAFRADLIVNEKILLEIKSTEKNAPIHKKQLSTYLKLTGLKLGYLLNFNQELMTNGISRIVNNLPDQKET